MSGENNMNNMNNRDNDPSALWTRQEGNTPSGSGQEAPGGSMENPYSQGQTGQQAENPYSQSQAGQQPENPYSHNQAGQQPGSSYTRDYGEGNPEKHEQENPYYRNYNNNWQNNSSWQNNNSWQDNGSYNSQGNNNNKPGKKGGFGKTILKIAAGAAVFGLVAGGIFYGINKLSAVIAQNLLSEQEADSGYVQNDAEVKKEDPADIEKTLPGTGTMIESTAVLSEEDSDITDLSGIVEDVMPSIVAVNSTVPYTSSYYGYYYGEEEEAESSGSGVIYGEDSENLYIVSNHHVIANATSVKVTFIDKTTVNAAVKGSDSDVDLAVLVVKLKDLSEETKKAIKQITIGSSDELEVGEMVIAIGNALGYGQSMTAGYISAKDRAVTISDTGVTMTLLQTDAAINPGNSGGALLNMKGELVGITNLKYAQTKVEGMGFAIPISDATSIISELQDIEALKDEEKGYLGISCENITQEQNMVYNIPVGVYVTEVAKGGAAQKAGIMTGDIITKVNGTRVETRSSLQGRINSKKVGTEVKISFQRSESGVYKEHEVNVILQGQDSLGSITENQNPGSSKDSKEPGNGNEDGTPKGGNDSGNANPYYDDYDDFFKDFFGDYYNR